MNKGMMNKGSVPSRPGIHMDTRHVKVVKRGEGSPPGSSL